MLVKIPTFGRLLVQDRTRIPSCVDVVKEVLHVYSILHLVIVRVIEASQNANQFFLCFLKMERYPMPV